MKKGFSLPIWVAASAKSAVKKLLGLSFDNYELIKIPNQTKLEKIKVHSTGFIGKKNNALSITFADSGLDLDLTRNLEIWTFASFKKISLEDQNRIDIIPGFGVGVYKKSSDICISNFALSVIEDNLINLIPDGKKLRLEIIFPSGEFLAERTSNKSFGVVNGLSIIGTTADAYTSTSPDQLNHCKKKLKEIIASKFNGVVTFVIGENGLDLAERSNISTPILKVGNWIGPLLVYAASNNVRKIILFGYHGKLIKLAGGIFHTHNHLADSRIEIFVYLAIQQKVPIKIINKITQSQTIDDALKIIESSNISLANKLLEAISNKVESRSVEYINKYIQSDLKVASVLFDRERKIRWVGKNAQSIFP